MKFIKYLGVFILFIFVIKCFNSNEIPLNSTAGENSFQVTNVKSNENLWYVGGNLHKKTISEWKNATEDNKLATCGDFVANVKKDLSLTELKYKASELKDCIEQATTGTNASDQSKVSEIGALCLLTLGY